MNSTVYSTLRLDIPEWYVDVQQNEKTFGGEIFNHFGSNHRGSDGHPVRVQ